MTPQFSLNHENDQMVVVCPESGDWLPRSGIWREVMGMVAETLSWNTVRDSSTVTPAIILQYAS